MNLVAKTCKICNLPETVNISNIFLQPKLLLLVEKHFKFNVKYLYVTNLDSQEVVAVTSIVEKKLLGIPNVINPQILYYQPIEIFIPKKKYPNEEQLQEIDIYKQISNYFHKYYLKVSKNLSPEIDDVRGFVWSGLSANPLYTYRFLLTDYTSDNYFKKQRASLRKAQKLGFQFNREVNVDRFFELVKGTKTRQEWGFNYNLKVLKNYLEDLLELGFAEQFNIVNHQNVIVSTMFCLMDKHNKTSYAWFASTDVNELANGVSTQLLHETSEYLKKDYYIFDLCGANTETIARFKASLGAQLKVFYRIKL